MKCKIIPVVTDQDEEVATKVEIKLHRHTIEITGLRENDAFELEELLMKATKIKVRRYDQHRVRPERSKGLHYGGTSI